MPLDDTPSFYDFIQTYGEYLNANPHLHALVADGLFTDNGMFGACPAP